VGRAGGRNLRPSQGQKRGEGGTLREVVGCLTWFSEPGCKPRGLFWPKVVTSPLVIGACSAASLPFAVAWALASCESVGRDHRGTQIKVECRSRLFSLIPLISMALAASTPHPRRMIGYLLVFTDGGEWMVGVAQPGSGCVAVRRAGWQIMLCLTDLHVLHGWSPCPTNRPRHATQAMLRTTTTRTTIQQARRRPHLIWNIPNHRGCMDFSHDSCRWLPWAVKEQRHRQG
jgi:hypothetical protein